MENNLKENFLKTKDPLEEKYLPFIDLEFDYEINKVLHNTNLKENQSSFSNNSQLIEKLSETFSERDSELDYNEIFYYLKNNSNEKFNDQLAPRYFRCEDVAFFKKNYFKALVSNKRIRLINNHFDLDLVYITSRVVAMGFPATGCESLYRNSLSEVKRYFETYHNNKIKVYNLCLETEKIYSKSRFPENEVALFPFSDHQICPARLMLEFCVDMILFLSKNKENTAAVHCKAGKGRTGVMICSYLIFSGICKSTDNAIESYSYRRSYFNKGVEIASQKRYIRHFETYLSCNFQKPYFKMIPKIIRDFFSPYKNLLLKIFKEKKFTDYRNKFRIHKIKIGPFTEKNFLDFVIEDFKNNIKFSTLNESDNINYKYYIKEKFVNKKKLNYTIIEFNSEFIFDNDINIKIKSKKNHFNFWLNLFYISLEKYFYCLDEIFELDFLRKNAKENISEKYLNTYQSNDNFEVQSKSESSKKILNYTSNNNHEYIRKSITLLDDKNIKSNHGSIELNSFNKNLISIHDSKKFEIVQKADKTIDYNNRQNKNIMEILQNKDKKKSSNDLNTNKNDNSVIIKNGNKRISSSKNSSNKSEKVISFENSNSESSRNKVQINEYDLTKKNINTNFNSDSNLQDSNKNNKKFGGSSLNEDFCINKTDNASDNIFQEELVYTKLVQGDDDNKYPVYNDNYINNEEFGSFNFINIQEKFFNEKFLEEKKRENIVEELKDKLYNILFKSKNSKNFNFFKKIIDKYDANYLWKNDLIFYNEGVIKFLRENSIVDNNLSNFQYIDLNKIYNMLINNYLSKSISGFFKDDKKFKILFDAYGVDKFGNKKNMLKEFQVEIKYSFE